MQYTDASALFARAKDKTVGKPIGNNTRLVQVDSDYAIRLHNTNIVIYKPDGSIVLDSGGYRTWTTKDRINEYAHDIHVTQDMGLWYVNVRGQTILFEDHMTIPATGPIAANDGYDMQKAKIAVDRMASKYIKGYVANMMEHGITRSTSGDCFGCSMSDATNPKNMEPMGYDHYLDHFEEKYYVPSIFLKAIAEKNYSNPGMVVSMMEHDRRYMKREATMILQAFFRKRKLKIAELYARRLI